MNQPAIDTSALASPTPVEDMEKIYQWTLAHGIGAMDIAMNGVDHYPELLAYITEMKAAQSGLSQ